MLKKCFVSVSPWFLVLLVCAFWGNYLDVFLVTYLVALFHEFAHMYVAKALNVKITNVRIMPFGITLGLADWYIKSTSQEVAIALAGPIFNFILGVCCYFLGWRYLACVNISLGLINLVPIIPLDGGRVMKAVLVEHWGFLKAFNFTMKISRVLVVILLAFGLFFLFTQNFNFSVILITIFLLGSLSKEEKMANIIVVKNLIQNNEKLIKNDANRVRTVVAYATTPARFLLKKFSYNFYYVINVLNENEEIISTLTEKQVINGLLNKGIRCHLKDLVL